MCAIIWTMILECLPRCGGGAGTVAGVRNLWQRPTYIYKRPSKSHWSCFHRLALRGGENGTKGEKKVASWGGVDSSDEFEHGQPLDGVGEQKDVAEQGGVTSADLFEWVRYRAWSKRQNGDVLLAVRSLFMPLLSVRELIMLLLFPERTVWEGSK